MTTDTDFGASLESRTAAYCDRLGDCAALLPELFDHYANDGEYRETVERIESIESECDQRRRSITAAITNADAKEIGLLNTRINHNQSALIDFVNELDVVANHTERIAQELEMMQPDPDAAAFERLAAMADPIVEMTDVLSDVTERFIHGLARSDATETLTDGIEAIRELESRCDELRNDAITTAFETGVDQPLVYRELAVLLDELANTMEDLTDRIIIITSEESGIITEVDPDVDA